jgi:hypothetical protein
MYMCAAGSKTQRGGDAFENAREGATPYLGPVGVGGWLPGGLGSAGKQ